MYELNKIVRLPQQLRGVLSRYLGVDGDLAGVIRSHRRLFCLALCAGIAFLSFGLAFLVRFELSNLDGATTDWHPWLWRTVGFVVVIRMATFTIFGLHRATWRFAGAHDIIPVFSSIILSSVIIAPATMYLWNGFFPRSIFVIDALVCFVLLSSARFSFRLADDVLAGLGASHQSKVLVIGAGAAGNLTVRAMLTRGLVEYWPVAILDDDPYKHGTTIQGIPIVGPICEVAAVAQKTGAQAIVLALPTASTSDFYKVVRLCKQTGLPLKTTPDLAQILSSSNVVTRVSDFQLEDLLHRRPIRSDIPAIQELLFGSCVMVTGAAGSIGSELCRQIAEQGTETLICVDKDESGLFRLEHELNNLRGKTEIKYFLADIRNHGRMEQAFAAWGPSVVFHAAAYKHVPILQHHPTEAVANNVGGTQVVAELSDQYGVSQFVLISTDKAVNPTSVMGATKRIAERLVRSCNQRSATRFSIIRFGNVLGSNGSVVELFLNQIRTGKAVTITHPDIERFFMTIPEAVHLVLFSATMGQGGETFILDMGKPVKIDQLARQIIRLSGLTPELDVPIEYTGLRPGEKLYEELWTDQEKPCTTDHPGILQAPSEDVLPMRLSEEVDSLLASAHDNDLEGCWRSLLVLVPTFQGRTNGLAHIPPDRQIETPAS